MKKRERDSPIGDIRQSPPAMLDTQPLNEDEKGLLDRAYDLYDHFAQKLFQEHKEMRNARQMRNMTQEQRSVTAPPTNTLNSCIDNVIADQIDNMPEARMMPEREETAQSAEEMTDIVSYVLYQAGWPGKYQDMMEDSAVTGTGIAQVFWDEDLENGEGMVNVMSWHPEDFYPDPYQEDIQNGRACFKVTHTTVGWVEEHYPHARGYVQEEKSDTDTDISARDVVDGDASVDLIEFWYRRYNAQTRRYIVHMAQLAGHALLYSTELGFGGASATEFKDGVYAHGQYPFVLFKYRRVWRKPFGTGLVHDYSAMQDMIDRNIKYIDDNARESSIQRHFVRKNSGVSPEDFADPTKKIIEYEGNSVAETIQTFQARPLNAQIYQITNYLVDSMKQDCGQNQFSRGEGGLGVTAAAAIQALQEAGGKTTRWHTEQYKDAFREMIEQVLWVLSDYLDENRKFKIVGGWDSTGNMKDKIVSLRAPKRLGNGTLPKPAYTVRVQVQKNNPLQIQADNEFVMQTAQICAQGGQPLPPESVISLLRGYPNRASVLRVVQENSAQQQMIAQMQAQIEQLTRERDGARAVVSQYQNENTTPSLLQEQQTEIKYDGLIDQPPTSEE